ncbi:MAG: hypothetical protein R3D26_10395 [Cyanobacteriota/Melainabacteria group bacterium]
MERTVTDINGNINFIQTGRSHKSHPGGPLMGTYPENRVNTAFQGTMQSIGFSIPADARSATDDLIANRAPQTLPWYRHGSAQRSYSLKVWPA